MSPPAPTANGLPNDDDAAGGDGGEGGPATRSRLPVRITHKAAGRAPAAAAAEVSKLPRPGSDRFVGHTFGHCWADTCCCRCAVRGKGAKQGTLARPVTAGAEAQAVVTTRASPPVEVVDLTLDSPEPAPRRLKRTRSTAATTATAVLSAAANAEAALQLVPSRAPWNVSVRAPPPPRKPRPVLIDNDSGGPTTSSSDVALDASSTAAASGGTAGIETPRGVEQPDGGSQERNPERTQPEPPASETAEATPRIGLRASRSPAESPKRQRIDSPDPITRTHALPRVLADNDLPETPIIRVVRRAGAASPATSEPPESPSERSASAGSLGTQDTLLRAHELAADCCDGAMGGTDDEDSVQTAQDVIDAAEDEVSQANETADADLIAGLDTSGSQAVSTVSTISSVAVTPAESVADAEDLAFEQTEPPVEHGEDQGEDLVSAGPVGTTPLPAADEADVETPKAKIKIAGVQAQVLVPLESVLDTPSTSPAKYDDKDVEPATPAPLIEQDPVPSTPPPASVSQLADNSRRNAADMSGDPPVTPTVFAYLKPSLPDAVFGDGPMPELDKPIENMANAPRLAASLSEHLSDTRMLADNNKDDNHDDDDDDDDDIMNRTFKRPRSGSMSSSQGSQSSQRSRRSVNRIVDSDDEDEDDLRLMRAPLLGAKAAAKASTDSGRLGGDDDADGDRTPAMGSRTPTARRTQMSRAPDAAESTASSPDGAASVSSRSTRGTAQQHRAEKAQLERLLPPPPSLSAADRRRIAKQNNLMDSISKLLLGKQRSLDQAKRNDELARELASQEIAMEAAKMPEVIEYSAESSHIAEVRVCPQLAGAGPRLPPRRDVLVLGEYQEPKKLPKLSARRGQRDSVEAILDAAAGSAEALHRVFDADLLVRRSRTGWQATQPIVEWLVQLGMCLIL
nr:hypothetical protein HK105_007013 [Polyrhizophydium stewartii]